MGTNKLKLGIVTLAALASFICCSLKPSITPSNYEPSKKKEWNVSAYMDGDAESELFVPLDQVCSFNINQMEKVGSNSSIDVLVQFDPFGGFIKESQTKRYRIEKDGEMEKIKSYRFEDFDKEVNMGDLKTFKDFTEWIKDFDSKKRLLIIKGHGFGIMQPIHLTPVWIKEEKNNTLPVYSIDKVFKESLQGPIDVLVFDQCFMANIESAYQLRNYAEVMVASEDVMWFPEIADPDDFYGWIQIQQGIEYEKVLEYLTNNPDTSNEELGKFIVSSFSCKFNNPKEYYSKSVKNPKTLSTVSTFAKEQEATLSAIKLKNLESFVDSFSKFSELLIERLKDDTTRHSTVEALNKTLREVQKYNPDVMDYYVFIDLFDFLEKLDNYANDSKLTRHIKMLEKSDIILSSFYNSDSLKGSKGITIYLENFENTKKYESDAEKMKDLSLLREYYNKSDFAKKTQWDKVVELYQEYSKR